MNTENPLIAKFSTELFASSNSGSSPLGMANNEMELFLNDEGIATGIEWIINYTGEKGEENGDDDVIDIGIWVEDGRVVDYDGCFELPVEAVKLLNDNGFNTDDVE